MTEKIDLRTLGQTYAVRDPNTGLDGGYVTVMKASRLYDALANSKTPLEEVDVLYFDLDSHMSKMKERIASFADPAQIGWITVTPKDHHEIDDKIKAAVQQGCTFIVVEDIS